jgi:hypothetical protein
MMGFARRVADFASSVVLAAEPKFETECVKGASEIFARHAKCMGLHQHLQTCR